MAAHAAKDLRECVGSAVYISSSNYAARCFPTGAAFDHSFAKQWALDRVARRIVKARSPLFPVIIQRKHDLKDSPLGTQIEIISRYANLNWICLNSPPKHPIPEEKFEERYHYLPQAVIRQIPITYSYQGRTFEGGQIVRPLKAYTRYEFEHFFAFGLKCSNFDSQKTRYYYSGNMSTEKGNPNSIFSFLQDFEEAPKDREFLKFLVWTAINYLGVLNSHREKKMADELAESLEISKLTRAELDDLMFPIP